MDGSRTPGHNVFNEISGVVSGQIIQARDIHGTVHIHAAANVRDSETVPRQLPSNVRDFIGRGHALAALDELLDTGRHGQRIALITGSGGIGKTTLAVWWAHRVAHRFPDGQLYVNLTQFGSNRPFDPGDVIRLFLNAYGVPPDRIPVSLRDQTALYRSVLEGRRVLIVFDNALDANQVRPILPSSQTAFVLVTSRGEMAELEVIEGARSIPLGPLSYAEAWRLFTSHLDSGLVRAEVEALQELVERYADSPLALRLAASSVAANPGLPVSRFNAWLRETLEAPPEQSVRDVFAWSYGRLSPSAARQFRLLCLHLGNDMSLASLAALSGSSIEDAQAALEELVHTGMLSQEAPGRFRLHDLLRAYSRELSTEVDAESDLKAALRRMLTWYLASADNAAAVLAPQRPRDAVDWTDDKQHALSFDTYAQALQWCETERPYLVSAVSTAAEHDMHDVAWRYPVALWDFFNLRKYWTDWLRTCELGLASATRIGDQRAEAAVLHVMGNAYYDLRRLDDAVDHYQQALAIHRKFGDRRHEAWTLNNLGTAWQELHRFDEAIDCYTRAMKIRRELGDRWGEGWTLHNLGELHQSLRRYNEAIEYYQLAMANRRSIGDRHGEGFTLDNLGLVCSGLRRYDDAISFYERALEIRQEIGDQWGEGWTLNNLGTAHRELGRFRTAISHYERALEIRREISDRWGEGWTLDGLGTALQHTHQVVAARECWRAARRLLEDFEEYKADDETPRTPREVRVWCVSDDPVQIGHSTHVAFAVVAPLGVLAASRSDRLDNLLPQPIALRVLLQAEHAAVRPVTRTTVLEVDRTSEPVLFEVVPDSAGPVALVFSVYQDRDSQLLQEVRVELPVLDSDREVTES